MKAVEFFAGLAVQVFAVHHKEAFLHIGVVLEQRGGFEGRERFAAARGVPDVAVAAVLVNAVHDGLDGIDLVGPHHEQLLLRCHQHHVAADGLAQGALAQELVGKLVELGDLLVGLVRKLVDGQKPLVRIERKVPRVVVGEVVGVGAVADDEELQKAQQRFGVAVAGVVFVVNDLLHGPAGVDGERFQLHLHTRHAVDEDEHVIPVVAVVGADAQLVDHLEGVLAPVLDVDQRVVQLRAVFAGEGVDAAQGFGSGEHVGGDDLVQQAGEFAIGQVNAVQGLELLAEVALQCGAVADVGAVFVFEALELADEAVFDLVLFDCEAWLDRRGSVGGREGGHGCQL